MKGEIGFAKAKDIVLSILFGYSASTLFVWGGTWQQVAGIYLFSQAMWVILITYGEILRQRREGSRRSQTKSARN